MRFLSLFSGIEAASQAWLPIGWHCVGVAEVDPFPCAVLAHHYPDVPNLGDVTAITQAQVEALGPVDVVVGGFPCQDLSVAGKRKGLRHADGTVTRSGLFFDAMRIVRWARPRWLLLENVPGLFSSHGGRDFAAVVGEVLGVSFDPPAGGWENAGVAVSDRGLLEWATLDAQFFGVPQRRRRVFALADFGDWASRPPVLLERESLSGHPAPRREAGQVAPTVPSRRTAGGGFGTDFDCDGGLIPQVANPLTARMHKGINTTCDEGQTMVAHSLRADGFDASEDGTSNAILTASGGRAGIGVGAVAFTTEQEPKWNADQALTLTKGSPTGGGQPQAVAFAQNQRDEIRTMDTAGALDAEPGMKQQTYLAQHMAVRRLTPRECERLQGFPDDYTLIPYGKPSKRKLDADFLRYQLRGNPKHLTRDDIDRLAADGNRYKALGNSMAVPVMRYLGERIQMVEEL